MNQGVRQTALKGALLAGACCLLYSILLTAFGENPFGRFKYMIGGIYAIFFIGAMWHYRAKLNGGFLGAKDGVLIGLLLNAFATTIYVGGLYLLMKFTGFGEGAMEIHITQSLAKLNEAKEAFPEKMTEDLYQQTKDTIQSWDAFSLAADQIAFFMGAGFFNTVLFSLMMSHRPQVEKK